MMADIQLLFQTLLHSLILTCASIYPHCQQQEIAADVWPLIQKVFSYFYSEIILLSSTI